MMPDSLDKDEIQKSNKYHCGPGYFLSNYGFEAVSQGGNSLVLCLVTPGIKSQLYCLWAR